mmetsp:Transcript_18625/g.71856  ORF Transcript_18625/g.71856 Transcript_18625/m.71856 type:complete len:433 (-) Transcript_18625:659-1957(-)
MSCASIVFRSMSCASNIGSFVADASAILWRPSFVLLLAVILSSISLSCCCSISACFSGLSFCCCSVRPYAAATAAPPPPVFPRGLMIPCMLDAALCDMLLLFLPFCLEDLPVPLLDLEDLDCFLGASCLAAGVSKLVLVGGSCPSVGTAAAGEGFATATAAAEPTTAAPPTAVTVTAAAAAAGALEELPADSWGMTGAEPKTDLILLMNPVWRFSPGAGSLGGILGAAVRCERWLLSPSGERGGGVGGLSSSAASPAARLRAALASCCFFIVAIGMKKSSPADDDCDATAEPEPEPEPEPEFEAEPELERELEEEEEEAAGAGMGRLGCALAICAMSPRSCSSLPASPLLSLLLFLASFELSRAMFSLEACLNTSAITTGFTTAPLPPGMGGCGLLGGSEGCGLLGGRDDDDPELSPGLCMCGIDCRCCCCC